MDSEPADSAVQAFEALREEVAALRRGVELVYCQAQQAAPSAPGAPDYSPTLGKMEKALGAIAGRLEVVERHPTLRLTPGAYAQQVATGVRQVEHEAGYGVAQVQGHLSTALGELRAIIGSAHSQLAQQRREWVTAAIGAAAGFVIWYPLVLLVALLGGGHWLAGKLVGGTRWEAGWTLMQEANPVVADKMARLYKGCPEDATTELCETAMMVRTIPPLPTETTPPVAPPVPREGHERTAFPRRS